MQAQQDGRIKAGQAHGNRIAMRFFLFFRKGTAAAHVPPSRAFHSVHGFVRCHGFFHAPRPGDAVNLRANRAFPSAYGFIRRHGFFHAPRLCDAVNLRASRVFPSAYGFSRLFSCTSSGRCRNDFSTSSGKRFFCALRQIRFFDAQTHSTFPCCTFCANQTNPCHISPCC